MAETKTTRSESELDPEPPADGLNADAMRASIAVELFGDVVHPLNIHRFEVGEVLGEGGMGVVYRAFDRSLGRDVAVKVLAPGVHRDPRRRARMVREAQALARLSHPNVVQVYEVGDHQDNVFVAMELVDGVSLKAWLAGRDRTLDEIVEVFLQAGEGLHAAHAADLVHRDFKPANVMVGEDGRVRVLDFGLAFGPGLSTESADPSAPPSGNERLTRTGAVMGTPAYMAPEQILGRSTDTRTDQFSFCVSMFEAISGVRPYDFDELRREPDSASVYNWGAIPSLWRAPLQRGLSIAPAERWPSMESLLDALRRADRRHRRRPWIVGGVAGGTLLSAALWPAATKGPCDDLDVTLDWSEASASRIQAAFRKTDAPFATDVWQTARSDLDAFAERWQATREKACEVQPAPATVACLQRAQTVFDTTVGAYAAVQADNVTTAHQLSSLLERPSLCVDAPRAAFLSDIEPEHLRVLARALAAVRSQRYEDALEQLDSIIDSNALAGTDALAEAHRLRGRAIAKSTDGAAALDDVAACINEADQPSVKLRCRVEWTRLLYDLERYQSMRDGLRLLEAQVGPDAPASVRAEVQEQRGLLGALEDPVAAIPLIESAIRLRSEAGDEHELRRTESILANTLSDVAEETFLSRAENMYRDEIRERRSSLGPQHPLVATSLYNLAVLLADSRQEWADAEKLLREAESIEAATLDTEAPARARTRLKLGEILIRLDRLEEATPLLESAWSRIRSLPEDHSDHVAARTLLANVTLRRGDHRESLEHHLALARLSESDPMLLQNIADLYVKLGDAPNATRAIARTRGSLASIELDESTREILEMALAELDAEVALLNGDIDGANKILDELASAVAEYEAPPDRRDFLAAKSELVERIAVARARAGATR